MTQEEAWELLRTEPLCEAAWAVIWAVASRVARHHDLPAAFADEAQSDVVERIRATALRGELPAIQKSVYAYLYKAICRRAIELNARSVRQPTIRPARPNPRDFLHILEEEVVPLALGLREPHRQAAAAQDWAQLRTLVEEQVTLPRLLWGTDRPPDARASAQLATLYKRHERLRADMLEAIDILARSMANDHIDTALADRYRWMVAGLRRRRTAAWYEGARAFRDSERQLATAMA